MSPSLVLFVLSFPVIGVGLLKYRSDYRRYGHSTTLGVVAVLIAWVLPHCVLGYAVPMVLIPKTVQQVVGFALMALGLGLCVIAMSRFGSTKIVVGADVSRLETGGLYRFSRNPQYTGYALFPLGYALTGTSVMAYVGVGLIWVLIHFTALVEEEHLERTFGEEYREYQKRTRRYL
jgi:protein-S-isoprenylcysteine O-methyltransferase Ste14